MGSMKDALLKAGLKSTKTENHRESAKGRERKQSEKHQHTRNFCEHCETTHPDVERYRHRNPTTSAEWICVACADRLMIDDKFRATHQSDFAKKNMFKRFYGSTKDFSADKPHRPQKFKRGDADGNKARHKKPKNPNKKPHGNNKDEENFNR
ncbi:MAG: hypothetical protein GY909_02300 [Oligoflexia bacterium]|nr:hypothetical protein [Oligoflexia bacterium]